MSAAPAQAANAWSTCMAPYQRAMNALSGDYETAAFEIGWTNCSARLANLNENNFDLYYHYYEQWRGHYGRALAIVGKIGVKVWKKLATYGVRQGITRLG